MSKSQNSNRPVVITGMGTISPVGIGAAAFWQSLAAGRSGISVVERLSNSALPSNVAGEVKDFTEANARKTLLKPLRKMVKVMCREIQLGVAAASLALEDSGINLDEEDRTRVGVEYGANHMHSPPEVLQDGCVACVDQTEMRFDYEQWGSAGLGAMEPLWLLKYLPNMPACHIGIYADARGPNNSLTLAEASGNAAVGEAYRIIGRGSADVMITGSTGNQVHAVKCIQAALWDELAESPDSAPETWCKPFDKHRTGQVVAEGAAAFLLEDETHARNRGATVLGTILGAGSSCVVSRDGTPRLRDAMANAMRAALKDADVTPADVGHINAHGLGERAEDIEESLAIRDVFGESANAVPVTALKSYLGNSGSGCGTLELAGSLCSLREGVILPTLNYETPDPECPLNVVRDEPMATANKVFLNINVTINGQASAVVVCGA